MSAIGFKTRPASSAGTLKRTTLREESSKIAERLANIEQTSTSINKRSPKCCDDFDIAVSALQAGLTVLAGSSGSGKTALALNLANVVAYDNAPVVIFSFRETCAVIAERFFCMHGQLDRHKLNRLLFRNNNDWSHFSLGLSKSMSVDVELVSADSTESIALPELVQACIELGNSDLGSAATRPGLIIIDSLENIITSDTESANPLETIISALKHVSVALTIPVILISDRRIIDHQLARDHPDPVEVFKISDLVLQIEDEESLSHFNYCLVNKNISILHNRRGITGSSFALVFDKEKLWFADRRLSPGYKNRFMDDLSYAAWLTSFG